MKNIECREKEIKISYILYLAIFFILGYSVPNLDTNGEFFQKIINILLNLDMTRIVGIFMAIQILSVILTVVIGVVKNLDAEKGLKYVFFTLISIGIEMFMLVIYKLVS